ncbi:uncharacterized protein LOC124910686 [Impatiens glandulifera]|uniref:uncharacterized protein LOC124910686 n=1 Tax=Impatiens glandulifera TaxID=253017 RepID=UPI001FB17534|nr:uncharacterized protein LOC124910686 [Impatiens glandulifera]
MRELMMKSRILKKALFLSSILPLIPFLLHFLDSDHYPSSLPFKLFTYSSERNYMFLFFNGILVFLIANSSAERNSKLGSDHTVEQIKKNAIFERSVVKFETEKTGEVVDCYIDKYPIEEEEEIRLLNEDDDEEEVDDSKQNGKDEIELLSVDELNIKFEDFIRKMRKQIYNGGT